MRTFIFSIFLQFSSNIYAQRTLEATLIDEATRKPVSNVHVYLDGTNIGTTTDSLGIFRISVSNVVNSSLVISHILYEKIIIPDPFREALPEVIYMEEIISDISELIISANIKIDRKKRREMLDIFRIQLLGNDHAALVKIVNEDDIVLTHNKEQQELIAYSKKPLEIVNNYLKYRILWELIEFRISYSDQTVHNNSIQHVSYSGTAYFMDIGNNSKSLRTSRQEVFKKSSRHFFHLLAQKQMKVDPHTQKIEDLSSFYVFEMYDTYIKLVNPEKYFIVKEAPHDPTTKMAIIRPEMKDSVTNDLSIYVIDKESLKLMTLQPVSKNAEKYDLEKIEEKEYGYMYYKNIRYLDNRTRKELAFIPFENYSKITFSADTFHIDAYGNTNLYNNIQIDYKLSSQRLSNLLPIDYGYTSLEDYQAIKDIPIATNDLLTASELIESHLQRQLQIFPQEKIYVHTDKPCYLAGETVWFRVHLVDYATHNPTESESRYVYGELFNPADSLLQRIKISRDSIGVFHGHFDLTPTLPTGDYRLRFYTRYMEEAGEEYFFNRVISVGHALSASYSTEATFHIAENGKKIQATLQFRQIKDGSPFVPQLLRVVSASGKETFIPVNSQGLATFDILPERDLLKNLLYIEYEYNNLLYRQYIAVPPSRGEYHVSFFPEGGALPADAPVRVAFKALQSSGLGEQVTGKIYNTDGDTVAVFASNSLGMGSFSFTPSMGEKYTALCRNGFGEEKRFDLPAVSENSINLKVEWSHERLMIQVIHSAGTTLPDSLYLLLHCRGVPYYNELWTAGKTITIRSEQLPSGVWQLVLLDKNLNPVSERLVFNLNEQDMAKVIVSNDKENYKRREPVRTQIELTDYDSLPLQGSFSVSVTADSDVKPDSTTNIMSALLLTSELKGYVESPAWYFTGKNIGEIDHLLLTQGWSRYDVAAALQGNIRTPKSVPELLPEITGQVTSGLFLQNKGQDYYVIMGIAGNQRNEDATIANVRDGRFRLTYHEYPNGVSYMLQLVFPPSSIRAVMRLDTISYPPDFMRLPYRFDAERTDFDRYVKNTGQQYVSDDGELVRYIEELVISGKRIKGISPLSPGRMQDRIIPLDELSKKKGSAITLHQLLMSNTDVIIQRDENGTLRARYKDGAYYYDYIFVVDGKFWPSLIHEIAKDKIVVSNNLENILSIPTHLIEEIEIVRAPAPPIRLKDFGNMVVNDPVQNAIKEEARKSNPQTTTFTGFDHLGYLATILITTKARNGGIKEEKLSSIIVTPLGYQVTKEFYSPAYETAEQQNETTPDLRSTIYWNPDVRTNDGGKAEINFYAADTETSYTVIIEGITNDGVLIRKMEKIKMENISN